MPEFVPSFHRYLASKKTVDDRALNALVWETLAQLLKGREERLTVLEVGAGIGVMAERVVERGLLTRAAYTLLDEQPENIAIARERLAASPLKLTLLAADALEFCARPEQRGGYDLLIAHAFLDLLDLPIALPLLLQVLKPGGLFYFTLNFDGTTIFQPEIDPAFDARLEALYHRTMDERITKGRRSGDSRSGRHLFGLLRRCGAEILAAGSSDWTVFAEPDGRYPADEAYFLRFILHTFHGALRGHPEIETARLDSWMAERYAQLERGELVYIAHQMDFVGRTVAESTTN
ncbi:MAG: class I SAM-dependent methyltransferase [Anaerolineales bacterium]|nr:class I SAM-dependent methyltransferase [Anaerolineales bacterium]